MSRSRVIISLSKFISVFGKVLYFSIILLWKDGLYSLFDNKLITACLLSSANDNTIISGCKIQSWVH